MIEKISYEDMESYSKELKASADVIKELISGKNIKELDNFTEEVNNYSEYLKSIVNLYKDADKVISSLKENI